MTSRWLSNLFSRSLIVVATAMFLLLPASLRADLVPGTVSTDEFDSTRAGFAVGANDVIVDPVNAFRTSGGFENGHVLMRNGGATGTVSFIQFQSGARVNLGGVRLFAQNDGAANSYRRSMSRFRLLADTNDDGSFETVALDQAINPNYGLQAGNVASQGNWLDLTIPTGGVVNARQWRLEVTQGSNVQPFEGARLVEVDALGVADLTIFKSGPASVFAGQNVNYTITVGNPTGPSNASPIVQDPAPPGLTFVSNSGACVTAFPCSLATLGVGGTATINSVWTVSPAFVGASVTNTASVSSTTSYDYNAANNSSSRTTTVLQGADLSVTVTPPANAVPGTNASFTVNVTNNGPSNASGASVDMPTPPGLTFVSNSGGCTGTYPCSLGTIGAGSTVTIVSTFGVPSGYTTPDPISVTATASATTSDATGGNNSATATASVTPQADVSITKSGPASFTPGQPVTYTLSIANAGPSNAVAVSVADATPPGLTFVSTSGDCTTPFPCGLGTLAAGATSSITAVFDVPSNYTTPDPLVNTASVSTTTNDPASANNNATASSAGSSVSDLVITMTGPASVATGDLISFDITVKNTGPSDATNVVIDDPTPTGLTPDSIQINCQSGFPCTIPSLVAGASLNIQVIFRVTGNTAQPLINTATVSASNTDSNPSDNTASFSSTACPGPIASMVPLDQSTAVPQTGVFHWEDLNADSYDVYLGPVGSGCNTLYGSVIPSPGEPPVLSYADLAVRADYEWRVVAKRAGCAPVSSACLTFKSGPLCPTGRADPIFPPQGGKNFISPVLFKWSGVPDAAAYALWVSVNGGGFVRVGTTSPEETQLSAEVTPGAIEWYVETVYAPDCPTIESTHSVFAATGSCITEGSTLVDPPDGSTLTSPVRFEWTAVGSAIGYRVWVSVDGKFPIIVASAPATETSAIARVGSGTLDWFVESLFDRCPPALSNHRKFIVRPLSTCSLHTAPALIGPKDDSTTTSPVTFEWTAVPDAIGYTLWVSVDGDSPAVVASTTTETKVLREVAPGLVSWFIQPLFDQCPTTESAHGSFTVRKTLDCDHDKAQLTAPSADASLPFTMTTFIWTAVDEAIEYRVWLRADGAEKILFGTTTTETRLSGVIPPGRIEWWVESLFTRCPLTESDHSFFNSPRPLSCPQQAPTPLSPGEGDVLTSKHVTFQWSSVGALSYNVWLIPDNGFKTLVGSTSQSSLEADIEHGAFGWFVEAIFSGCPTIESSVVNFSFPVPADCDQRRPLLISPPDGATGLSAPIHFIWTPIRTATAYTLRYQLGDRLPVNLVVAPDTTELVAPLTGGRVRWSVTALFDDCDPIESSMATLTVLFEQPPCDIPAAPIASVIGQVTSGEPYRLFWRPVAGATIYEVLETSRFSAADGQPDFSGLTPRVVAGVFTDYVRTLDPGEQSRKLYYRVRGISDCHQQRGPYSDFAETEVITTSPSTQAGSQTPVVRMLTLCADSSGTIFECSPPPATKRRDLNADPVSFGVSLAAPWVSVNPATATIPAGGSTTLTVTSDPAKLPTGSSSTSIVLVPTSGGATSNVTNTMSLSSPVSPTPNTAPAPYSLIIPVVGHAVSGASTFESDVRITNASAKVIKYELDFTPSNNDGTQVGQQASLEVEPGQTTAIDDIIKSWYSSATTSVIGVLQVRPLNPPAGSSSLRKTTVVSSRTFSSTPRGTFGQWVPAIPFSSFIGGTEKTGTLSLQQISQSDKFRTNFGFLEGLGQPVTLRVNFFDAGGSKLGTTDVDLRAGEHKQLNSLMSTLGISSNNARAEVSVIAGDGRATAYASVVDNSSNDPYLVSPVDLSGLGGSRFVVPGVADLNSGSGHWRSDLRVLNAGTTPASMKVTFYQQNDPSHVKSVDVVTAPGEMKVLDDILSSLFGETNTGGAVHVTTTDPARLVVTARTYNQLQDGTYGQFVPAVTPADAAGLGDQPLQILQLEQSKRMRSNVGIAEVSGKPVTVEINAIVPEALAGGRLVIAMKPNEFRQMSSLLTQLGIKETFNGRVSIRVLSGDGRVTAYASVIDNATGDPTYIPAQ